MLLIFRRVFFALIMTLVTAMIFIAAGSYWLLTTTQGAKFAFRFWQKVQVLPCDMRIGQWQGDFLHGLQIKDIELTQMSYFPSYVTARIQSLEIILGGLDQKKWLLIVKNARFFFSDDPIVLQGQWHGGNLSVNLYARTLDLGQLVKLIPFVKNPQVLSGFVSNADVVINGPLNHLQVNGRLNVDHIRYKTTIVSQGSGQFELLADLPGWTLNGFAQMGDGVVQARRVTMDLMPSKVFFKGDPYNPNLDIHASSRVDKVNIDFGFKGTLRLPILSVVSDPPLPQDVLLVMLATGKNEAAASIRRQPVTLSGELVSGFFDYLLLGGQGGDFARSYGLPYEESSNKIGLKKNITDDVRLGLEVEQVPTTIQKEQSSLTQRVSGEMDVTDHVSVNVSQKVLSQDQLNQPATSSSAVDDKQNNETQIYLKYQNRF